MRLHGGKGCKRRAVGLIYKAAGGTHSIQLTTKEVWGQKGREDCPYVSSFAAYEGAVLVYRATVLRVLLCLTHHLGGFSLKVFLPQSVDFNKPQSPKQPAHCDLAC